MGMSNWLFFVVNLWVKNRWIGIRLLVFGLKGFLSGVPDV